MIKAVYKDIAVGVDGNITDTASEKQNFVDMSEISNPEMQVANYGTLEGNNWLLDGNTYILPDDLESADLGYWSTQMSDEDGEFEDDIVITRTYNGRFTSTGITIVFDYNKNIYATDINVKWYQDTTLLSDKNFIPNNSTYFCQNNVIGYNKIVFTFKKINKASRFLRVFQIVDGTIRTFYSDEIVNLEILESISDTGNELKINTMNLELISKSPVKMIFQKVQAISVYKDSDLYGTFFVDECSRVQNQYKVETYDLVGMLSNNTFSGGMYSNVSASTLIASIMKDIPYELDESLEDITISGYLPISDCRSALLQVGFAIGAVIDTSRNNKVLIVPVPEYDEDDTTSLDSSRIGVDVKEESSAPYTAIQVTEHKYNASDSSTELYNDTLSGAITITFSEPMRSLSISGGSIVESGTNYAIISGTGSTVTLTGYGYEDVETKKYLYNPNNTSNSIPNVFDVSSCTLVNSSNSTSILNRMGKSLFNNTIYDFDFLMEDEKVGDFVTITTDEGDKTGQIIDIEYELDGSKIWAKTKMREV